MSKPGLPPKLYLSLLILAISACSSSHKSPHHFSSINSPPRLSLLKGIDWNVRIPAGAFAPPSQLAQASNKQVYFAALFEQFQKFHALSPLAVPNINSCPRFHNIFLTLQKRRPPHPPLAPNPPALQLLARKQHPPSQVLALLPETALPLAADRDAPTVYQAWQERPQLNPHQLLTRGLFLHTQKIRRELGQLCHLGHGQNYFIFENLVSYMQKHRGFKYSDQALLSLFKTSVFTNYALLNSLGQHPGQRALMRRESGEREMIMRLRADWSQHYFKQLQQKRLALLKHIEAVASAHNSQVPLLQ